MDEILLGRPLLHSIGFNLEHHLVLVRNDIHDMHVDDLDPEQFKLSAAKYQGLSYINAEDDPIELPECLAAGIGQNTKSLIDNAFANPLQKQRKTVSPKRVREKLRKCSTKFEMCFASS